MHIQGVTAFVVSLLLGAVAFLIVARILPGFRLRGGFGSAVLVAFVYGVIKALLFWVLLVLSFPLVVVTLGLFIFVINAFLLWLTDKLIGRLEIAGAGTLFLGALLLSAIDFVFKLVLNHGAFF